MADDQALDGGTGTNPYTAAADDVGGAKYQRVKISVGADGVVGDATPANPLPVDNVEMPAAAVIGDSDANPTTTQVASVLQGWTGSVWQRLKSGPNSDGIGANGFLNVLLMLFNGVTYDRIRGDAANGVDVDVTRVGGTVAVTDNAGSLTVDAPVGTPLAVRLSDGSAFQQATRVDNQPFTDNSSNVTPSGYIFDESAGTALTEDDAAAARIDSKRAQVIAIEDATTRGRRVTVSASGALATELPTAAALGDSDANPTAPKVGSALMGWTGSVWARLRTSSGDGAASTGVLNVLPMMVNAGTGNLDRLQGDSAKGLVTQSPFPVQAATATLANVAASASSVTLQASNAARKSLVIVNDSTSILYVKFGSAASTTSYTYFLNGSQAGVPSILELPAVCYTGIVTGIWASAVGNARMTELT